jgi:hypothetical protein
LPLRPSLKSAVKDVVTSSGDPTNYIHIQLLQAPDVWSPMRDSYNSDASSNNTKGSLFHTRHGTDCKYRSLNQTVPRKAEKRYSPVSHIPSSTDLLVSMLQLTFVRNSRCMCQHIPYTLNVKVSRRRHVCNCCLANDIILFVCMYVCMNVCMYVCMYLTLTLPN